MLEEPWAKFTFAERSHREALAEMIADNEVGIVIVGPLATSGMNEAGTLQEVRAFLALCDEVRQLAGRSVTFMLIHHENRAGRVSGAWEGAVDTLLHVSGEGTGAYPSACPEGPLGVDLACTDMELAGAMARASRSRTSPSCPTTDIEDAILDAIDQNPGGGWKKIERGGQWHRERSQARPSETGC